MKSARLIQLEQQLDLLKEHLLPDSFDPTIVDLEHDAISTRILAYRLLAHAEIESFFEERVLEVLSLAHLSWKKTRAISRVAFCLLAFSGREMTLPPATLEAPSDQERKKWGIFIDVGEKLAPVISDFHRSVSKENHGIKEKNLLSMLLPIGVQHSSIDPTFLADINSFGALRGLSAHNSSSKSSVRQGLNPMDELNRVTGLLEGIESLDKEINALTLEFIHE